MDIVGTCNDPEINFTLLKSFRRSLLLKFGIKEGDKNQISTVKR